MPERVERITAVEPYEGIRPIGYGREAGYTIATTAQTVTLAIDDEPSCCESWGYFLTEDDTTKFIGAELRGVSITDTNRSGRRFGSSSAARVANGRTAEGLEECDVLFVDIETDRGVLQFVAYNSHNGYYGHEARVSSRELTHEVTL